MPESPPPPPSAVFAPKLFSTIKSYTLSQFTSDAVAGVIVGIVALPLAIAFAIASGVTPDRGLITAIIAGLVISTLGGSRVQIGGPTGAFVVLIYGIVRTHGIDGLMACTLIAGVMLVLMGLFRLGSVIKFIPYPLTVGFTAGIAVIIFSSQIQDLLGLKIVDVPADFLGKWGAYFKNAASADLWAIGLSALSLAVILLWPRVNRRIPGSLIAIFLVTALVQVFHLPVETIGSRFGEIPSGLPRPSWPDISFADVRQLFSPALTVALLGAIESLLSATVADGMIEGRHRSNTELIAQGIANIVTPLFGGIPATGAIARTATNVKNGAKTPVAGIIHALTLLAVMLLFGHWAKLIPLCVLGAILIVVAYNMSEWHAFKALLKAPRMDVAVLLTTFFLTVFIDLTFAVEIGLLLSLILFMKRMTDATSIRQITREMADGETEQSLREAADSVTKRVLPEGVEVFEAEGAFFFGAAELLRDTFDMGKRTPKVLILRMRHVLVLDASGLRALRDLRTQCRKRKADLILAGVHAQPLIAMERAGMIAEFGEDNLVGTLDEALVRAGSILNTKTG